jgi:hypothetical protein
VESEDPFENLKAELESGDQDRVIAALNALSKAEAKHRAIAAGHVDRLLRRGSTVPILLRALDTAAALAQSSSSSAVAAYTRHRVASVRHSAAQTLTLTRGPAAVSALLVALRGNDAKLRDIAATGLGTLDAKQAVQSLFEALDHQVGGAAGAIGKLCDPKQCQGLLDRINKQPLDALTPGFDEILFRSDVGDAFKLQIIEKMGSLHSSAATTFLESILLRWPKKGSDTVRNKLKEVIVDNGGTVPKG